MRREGMPQCVRRGRFRQAQLCTKAGDEKLDRALTEAAAHYAHEQWTVQIEPMGALLQIVRNRHLRDR
jgi:hypothetical protein